MMCDRKIPKKLKYILYKTVVRPVLLRGAECWTVGRREEQILENTEMRLLRRIAGVTLRDMIRSEQIREQGGVADIVEKLREARLRSYGYVIRREEIEGVRRVMEMEVDGKRKRGRPKKRWEEGIAKDLDERRLTREDAVDRGE